MKKDTLLKGAMIASLSTILIKVLGVIYTIPLNALIGEQGGALYGYGYQVYNTVATIAMIGLPLAVSKIIAKYHSLGYYKTGERVFTIGKRLLLFSGIIGFIVMFFLAEPLFLMIIPKEDITKIAEGGNTIEDIVFIIRIMSLTLIVIPYMSVLRGYLQGNHFISPTSYSQLVEQVARILFILVGGYLVMNVFKLGLTPTVGVATLGAFIGGGASLVYLQSVIRKHKESFNHLVDYEHDDPEISSFYLLKELIIYALPFMLIAVNRQLYNTINMAFIPKHLSGVGYSQADYESIWSVISVYGFKLTAIITSISAGFTVSLIPSITKSYVAKDHVSMNKKINQIFGVLSFLVIPMAIGLSLLSDEMYFVFYGYSKYGASVFQVLVLITIITSFANISTTILQVMNQFKFILFSIVIGLLIKITINYPLVVWFENQFSSGYHGVQVATMLGYGATMAVNIAYLIKKININLTGFFKNTLKSVALTLMMSLIVIVVKKIIPLELSNRLIALIYSGFVAILGGGAYLFASYKIGLLEGVLGNEIINKFTKRIKK